MFSKAGTPCNNYAGYCDVFQKCREVDPAGKFTFFWGCFRFFKLSFRNNCCHLTEFAGKLCAIEIDLPARSWFARYLNRLNLMLFDIIAKCRLGENHRLFPFPNAQHWKPLIAFIWRNFPVNQKSIYTPEVDLCIIFFRQITKYNDFPGWNSGIHNATSSKNVAKLNINYLL